MSWCNDETLKKKFQMYDNMATSIKTGVNEFVQGDWNVKSYYVSRVGSEVVLTLVGAKGAQYATKAIKLGETAEAASVLTKAITNPLPENGLFSRVISAEHYAAWVEGKAPLGGKDGMWITAADDLKGISTSSGVQQRLSLFDDYAGTTPRQGQMVRIDFKLDNPSTSGISSPIQTVPERGYGFIGGGQTGGESREWLIDSSSNINVVGIEFIK
jgi:hypothetical protein